MNLSNYKTIQIYQNNKNNKHFYQKFDKNKHKIRTKKK